MFKNQSRRRFVISLTSLASSTFVLAACGEPTATTAVSSTATVAATKAVTSGAISGLAMAQSKDGWSYEGSTGIEKWGDLKPEYSVCKMGQNQSPIDIPDGAKALTEGLKLQYNSTPIKIENKGYTVELAYEKGSTLEISGKTFNLLQFHFHTPGEHKLSGKVAAMEMHLVHKAADGTLAVVGVLMEEGADNSFLAKFWDKIPAKVGEAEVDGKLNVMEALPPLASGFYTYGGSLTTPPCSEGVMWNLMKQPVSVSKAQVDKFLSIIGKNARLVQPLNGRAISSK